MNAQEFINNAVNCAADAITLAEAAKKMRDPYESATAAKRAFGLLKVAAEQMREAVKLFDPAEKI